MVFHIEEVSYKKIEKSFSLRQLKKEREKIIMYVVDGKAEYMTKQETTAIKKNDFIILPSEAKGSINLLTAVSLNIFLIRFQCAYVSWEKGNWILKDNNLLDVYQTNIRIGSIVQQQFEKLCEIILNEENGYSQQGTTNSHFIKLLKLVYKEVETQANYFKKTNNIAESISQVKLYLDENYAEKIQIEQMARLAEMNTSSFYHYFKEYTGMTPLHYLTNKRLDQSKKTLLSTNIEISEVARGVGYEDEYYFSRVFKRNIGISPIIFRNSLRKKVVILTPVFIGDFLALGGELSSICALSSNKSNHKSLLKKVSKIKFDLNELQCLEPDLIVGSNEFNHYYEHLTQISRTALIPVKNNTWKDHLYQLAESLEIREAAHSWLRQYDQEAKILRDQLKKKLADQTVLAIRLTNNHIRIFGEKRRKISDVLYRDLELNPPKNIKGMQFRDITWDVLNEYRANHILLFADHDTKVEIDQLQTLFNSNIYHFREFPFLTNSAMGNARLLSEVRMHLC